MKMKSYGSLITGDKTLPQPTKKASLKVMAEARSQIIILKSHEAGNRRNRRVFTTVSKRERE